MTSKKHYVAIAREIAELRTDLEGSNAGIAAIVQLASRLACINEVDIYPKRRLQSGVVVW
jgi:hypothetical protein